MSSLTTSLTASAMGWSVPWGPHAHGSHAHLDAGQRLALQPGEDEHGHREEGQQRHAAEAVGDLFPDAHLSTSPSMMSMEPRITTASAM